MTDNMFGPLVGAGDVQDAVEATVRLWLPSYLAEVARRDGREAGALPAFLSYTRLLDIEDLPQASQIPACVIVCPGTGDIVRHGTGRHDAEFAVGVGAVVAADTRDHAERLAKLYTLALRALLVQHPTLGNFASGVWWEGDSYSPLPVSDRILHGGSIQVTVAVEGVLDDSWRATVPPEDATADPGPWPTVEYVSVTVEREAPL